MDSVQIVLLKTRLPIELMVMADHRGLAGIQSEPLQGAISTS
jgi:hypothetical protein